MVGQPNRWRVRVTGAGDYRIVYEVHDQQLLVLVVAVAHRREVFPPGELGPPAAAVHEIVCAITVP